MSTAPQKQPISVAEYLAGELVAKQKHEFVDGVAYAMSGAPARHNRIATNVTVALGHQLRDKPCEVFNSDMKVRVRQKQSARFYYPDVSVVCDSNPDNDMFQDRPVVVVEVISESTRRLDEFEKREAYLSIDSLCCYILLEQDCPYALVYRRTDEGFEREHYEGLEAMLVLSEVGCQLQFADAYAKVTFPQPGSEEE